MFEKTNKQKTIGSLSNNLITKSFYANAVCPGLVFIEKLQNNDLMMTSFAALRRPNYDIWRFQGWPFSSFGLISLKKYMASKYTMFLNETLYQSQEISPIFEMSQSETIHHFWWEFPPASLWEAWHPFKRPGLPLSYLKCLQMGGGGTMGQFSPWPRFISIIDNTYIFYTSYAYLFVIRSDRISRHPRNREYVRLIFQIQHLLNILQFRLTQMYSGKVR